ncbi:hypothetical protein HU200_007924 [Digitaria exilis]|uniref:AP2/ERF and B3 domain-containing protein n=1 Tax=Digitaria exilis TaxID=1010633 RepID=A0A835KPC4_9POAL|nr:hypothetical protein HU200_007924 [Digitaria exilis]
MDSDDEASPAPARSSSRYKGVVPQPKGRWGAQIYERHARVWLGTFADEAAAARAYDVAALRFRGRGGAMEFLAARPKSEVVDMLRKHTYDDELRQALRSGAGDRGASLSLSLVPRVALFEKAVTPSDLHAEKHFPPLAAGDVDDAAPPVLLAFEDVAAGGKVWRFRYSYWSSSQSYVLTRGWSRFVREKGVVDGDTVAFSQAVAVAGDGEVGGKRRMFIECRKRKRNDDDDRGDDDCCPDGGARVVRLFGANIAAATTGD